MQYNPASTIFHKEAKRLMKTAQEKVAKLQKELGEEITPSTPIVEDKKPTRKREPTPKKEALKKETPKKATPKKKEPEKVETPKKPEEETPKKETPPSKKKTPTSSSKKKKSSRDRICKFICGNSNQISCIGNGITTNGLRYIERAHAYICSETGRV
jgi:outer membrane biosynthesis protein TonB